MPCIVSETVPGSPAWEAGLEPGDEILQIGRAMNPTFIQLREGVMLGDLQAGLPLTVRRAGDGTTVDMTLKPVQKSGGLATIGIANPQSLKLFDVLPVIDNTAATRAKLVSPKGIDKDKAKFKGGDEIIRVGDKPVTNYRELSAELTRQPDQPLRITVRRQIVKKLATSDAEAQDERFQELTFDVPPQPLKQFGLDLRMGPATAIRANTAAASAGIKPGDVIEQIDGKPAGQLGAESWNASALSDYLRRAAQDKRDVQLTLQRPTGQETAEKISAQLAPAIPSMFNSPFPERTRGTPMAANEIGVAYRIENQLASVAPGSPAAAVGLATGDEIIEARMIFPKVEKVGTAPDPITIELGSDHPNWPTLLDLVQLAPDGTEVEFKVQRGNEAEPRKVTLKPVVAEGAFLAARGFLFEPIERIRKATTIKEQVRYGWNETVNALTMVFRFLKKLGTQVPMSALGGPITIAKAAGMYAAEGIPSLLIFLTTLSANLAVLNFLPIPLLDGGHMVFLIYEGLRGRPANEKFVVALHTAGFIFIVSLMLYVLALDLELIPRNL
jgi:regulator of sigma E protease